jgi:hypothetical protein
MERKRKALEQDSIVFLSRIGGSQLPEGKEKGWI